MQIKNNQLLLIESFNTHFLIQNSDKLDVNKLHFRGQ